MSRLKKTGFFALLFTLYVLAAYSETPAKDDSLRCEVLLNSKVLEDSKLDVQFIKTLDITTDRLILLSTTDQFYLLGWGGLVPLGNKVAGPINSYACTPDGLLMAIRSNELCAFDPHGNLSKLFGLPRRSMDIAAGKYVMYVYDHDKDGRKNALYVIAKGGKYSKLFEIPTPICSVVEINDTILFSTGRALFSYNIKDKELKPLYALQEDKEIISVAVDASRNTIYFSTDSIVYALTGNSAVLITDTLGGVLRYFDDGLIVFDPDKKLLIRILGIGDKISAIK